MLTVTERAPPPHPLSREAGEARPRALDPGVWEGGRQDLAGDVLALPIHTGSGIDRPMPFPRLNFITHDPMESDYRPAVDATGRHVIFERMPRGGGVTTLFITSIGTPHGAEPFIHDLADTHATTGPSQTRPDWCWATGHVALNVAALDRSPPHVMIAEPSGIPLGNVPGSTRWIYPTWSSDGTQLVVMTRVILGPRSFRRMAASRRPI
jgi:hypothetical protein